jgi:ketosteroid isomerase-like protein
VVAHQDRAREDTAHQDVTGTSPCHRLFDALARGDLATFVGGCAEELVLTVSGSDPMTTRVARAEISSWYRSMGELAGSSFRSEVCLVLVDERATVVLLRHALSRRGVEYRYETVNRCTLRDGRLASWFSHPVRRRDYALAWGIDRTPVRRPA